MVAPYTAKFKMGESVQVLDDFLLDFDDKNSPLKFNVVSEKVTTHLPAYIRAEDLDSRPCFQKLLVDLCDRVTEQGLIKTKRDLQENAFAKVRLHRKPWLRHQVFFQCLRELIHDWQLEKRHKNQYQNAFRDAFHTSEICAYLSQPSDVHLLGLNKDDVIDQSANPMKLDQHKNQFINELEEFIKRKCEHVTRFHDTKDQGSKVLSARTSMLPMVVENEKIKYAEEKKNLVHERRNVDKQLAAYHKALERVSLVFEDLLTRVKLTVLSEKDRIDCDWLLARAEALMLKSRIIELQLSCELYNRNTVGALNALSCNVDDELQTRENEMKQVELMLQAYEAVGPGYDQLVTEFAKLRDTLDDKIWARRELAGNLQTT